MKTGIKIGILVTLIAIAATLILFVYPYAKSYNEIESYDKREKLPLKGDPKIYASSGSWIDDYKRMVASNFVLLGTSDYNGGEIGSKAALTLATLIGAQIVIVAAKYADAETDPIPFHTLLEQQKTKSADAPGAASIPQAIANSSYGAQFWARARQPVFGANFSNFDMADARAAGTEEGVKVYVVIRNSPAFNGNINVHDLITHVDHEPVRGVEGFMNIIERNAGNVITLSVIRNGNRLSLPIKLNDIE